MNFTNLIFMFFFLQGSECFFQKVPFNQLDILRFGFRVSTSFQGVKWPKLTNFNREKYKTLKVNNESLRYPDYYLRDFHAYNGGNLNWIAAEECMAASEGVMAFHNKNKTGRQTNEMIREKFMEIKKLNMVDMACGIGLSTSIISNNFEGNVVGVDMSPYFLNKAVELFPRIRFVHGNVESLDIPNNSQDIVFISYLLHELPFKASVNVIKEANRILRKGGKLAILDMDPNIKSSNCLRQYIFDNTEPYIEDYKLFYNVKDKVLELSGFSNIIEIVDIYKTRIIVSNKQFDFNL